VLERPSRFLEHAIEGDELVNRDRAHAGAPSRQVVSPYRPSPARGCTGICLDRNMPVQTYSVSMSEAIWAALLDPHRRAVLAALRVRPHAVGELVGVLGLTQPAMSKHLRVMRNAGLVRVVQDAQRRIYALDPAPLVELDAWLAPYRAMWNDSLDALGEHLDNTPDPKLEEKR
jgi:DNA-binding transcriptional ArsR family regulator